MRQGTRIGLLCILVVVAGVVLAGCGGGGGGSAPGGVSYALYGTAAAGSPIAGIVNVKGANGATASTTIGLDGAYAFTAAELSGLTKPYILFAQGTVNGKSASIYSACVADGRINITPITDFILRTALAAAAEMAYDAWNGSVTANALTAAEAKVQTQLQPVLDAAGVSSADLMSGQFNADHSGLDKVLDIVSISYDGSGTTATVTNTVTNSTFNDNVTSTADDSNTLPASDSANTTAALTDEQSINNVFSSLCTLYVSSRPTYTALNTWAGENVAADYLDQGENRDQMVSAWTVDNEGPGVGCTLTAAITGLVSGVTPTYTKGYSIAMTYRDPSFTGTFNFNSQVVYNGTKWLWYGDRKWIDTDFGAEMHRQINSSGTNFYSGIGMWMDDNYSYAYNQGVRSAVVSAVVGTTTGYVVLGNQFPDTWYSIQSGICANTGGNHCWLDNAIISQMVDFGSYTVKLCSEDAAALASNPMACTALQTYVGAIGKKPLLNTQLTNAMFPTLITPSSLSVSGMGWDDGFVQISWSNPAQGLKVDHVDLQWPTATGYGKAQQDFQGTSLTSVNLDTAGQTTVPTNAGLWMSGWDDANNVQYSSSWSFN